MSNFLNWRKTGYAVLLIFVTGTSIGAAYSSGTWPGTETCKVVNLDQTIQSLYGSVEIQESKEISIEAPDIGENGAIVPVTVSTRLPNTRSISLLVERNPDPFAATFKTMNESYNQISTRLKVDQCSNIIALVEADDTIYLARHYVKITSAGCGG